MRESIILIYSHLFYFSMLILMLPFNFIYAQTDDFRMVNGWRCLTCGRGPIRDEIPDTLRTISYLSSVDPYEGSYSQVFGSFANKPATYFGTINGAPYTSYGYQTDWKKDFGTLEMPDSFSLNMRVLDWTNVTDIYIWMYVYSINDSDIGGWAFLGVGKAHINPEENRGWTRLIGNLHYESNYSTFWSVQLAFHAFFKDSTWGGVDIDVDNLMADDKLMDGFGDGDITSILDDKIVPLGFELHQNYPNPFNPSTKIKYEVPEPTLVQLNVYSLLGEKVFTLVNKEQEAGSYEISLDGKDLPSGTYIYALQTDKYRMSRKMILLK